MGTRISWSPISATGRSASSGSVGGGATRGSPSGRSARGPSPPAAQPRRGHPQAPPGRLRAGRRLLVGAPVDRCPARSPPRSGTGCPASPALGGVRSGRETDGAPLGSLAPCRPQLGQKPPHRGVAVKDRSGVTSARSDSTAETEDRRRPFGRRTAASSSSSGSVTASWNHPCDPAAIRTTGAFPRPISPCRAISRCKSPRCRSLARSPYDPALDACLTTHEAVKSPPMRRRTVKPGSGGTRMLASRCCDGVVTASSRHGETRRVPDLDTDDLVARVKSVFRTRPASHAGTSSTQERVQATEHVHA
jgi:hypothetical protein